MNKETLSVHAKAVIDAAMRWRLCRRRAKSRKPYEYWMKWCIKLNSASVKLNKVTRAYEEEYCKGEKNVKRKRRSI